MKIDFYSFEGELLNLEPYIVEIEPYKNKILRYEEIFQIFLIDSYLKFEVLLGGVFFYSTIFSKNSKDLSIISASPIPAIQDYFSTSQVWYIKYVSMGVHLEGSYYSFWKTDIWMFPAVFFVLKIKKKNFSFPFFLKITCGIWKIFYLFFILMKII